MFISTVKLFTFYKTTSSAAFLPSYEKESARDVEWWTSGGSGYERFGGGWGGGRFG